MKAYRICELKNDNLLTLFHSLNKTRILPINAWIEADIKIVSDGSKKTSKKYMSGFHVLLNENECRNFVKKFRVPRELVMVECEVNDDLRKKEHSPYNVYLANKMKILRVVEKLHIVT